MTLRAPCGGGFGGGPFHSEELESLFCHIPGIKVVYPAYPTDARGLLYSSVLDPNPVIFLENKYLYRRIKELVPKEMTQVPIGVARVRRNGKDAGRSRAQSPGGPCLQRTRLDVRRHHQRADHDGLRAGRRTKRCLHRRPGGPAHEAGDVD